MLLRPIKSKKNIKTKNKNPGKKLNNDEKNRVKIEKTEKIKIGLHGKNCKF